uniref:Ubiquitin-like protease family profile domain-containing protein n=1 Tax=Ciona intestinalis TaxID=7719 RepID=F6X6W1_CIOIN
MFPVSNSEGPQSKFQKIYEDILVGTSQPQVFTSDSDQLTLHTGKRKSTIPKKRSSTKIVPSINMTGRDENQPLLKVGQNTLSYVQLMTLEKSVNAVDRNCLRSFDETFQVGKLCDNIINSYLWQLTSRYNHVIHADTSVGYRIQHGEDVGQLWENVKKNEKSYAFIPWKSNGQYWVMIAINIKERKLLYLDPNQTDDIDKTQYIYEAKEFINRSLS